ncbi:hypothetical protein PMIN06_010134 [Paraphaeosphaeria minitans]
MPPSPPPSCGHCNRNPAEGEAAFLQCSRCKEVVYCSSDCQRHAWTAHKDSCQLAGLVTLTKAATTLIPTKCGACKKTANIVCDGCRNMAYCSPECQQNDMPMHKILCASFKDFQERPGDHFFRGIYFPEQGGDPHFVWLEGEGMPFHQRLTGNTTNQLLGDGYWHSVDFDRDQRFARPFAHQLSIYHRANFLIDGSHVNACVASLIGYQLARGWRGPFLATARKYKNCEEDYGVVEMVDKGPDGKYDDIPLVLMDVDTTSLAPVLAHLKLIARAREIYNTHGMAAEMLYNAKVHEGHGVDVDVDVDWESI